MLGAFVKGRFGILILSEGFDTWERSKTPGSVRILSRQQGIIIMLPFASLFVLCYHRLC